MNLKSRVLNTAITYGTTPASFIATKCLSVLDDEIAISKPLAAESIHKDFYVDNLIIGSDTIEEAI